MHNIPVYGLNISVAVPFHRRTYHYVHEEGSERRLSGPFSVHGWEKIGEGREPLSEESVSLPSPNPIPPSPKTFGLIESLLEAFPEHGCFGCAMGLGKG
mgnify:CR=1 FL=1